MALKLALKPKTTVAAQPVPQDEAVKAATEYRALALESDEIEAKMKVARAALLEIVTERRDTELKAGKCDTTVKIPTTDGNRVLVVYQERFKALSDENIDPLKESFGKDYSLFVEESETVSLRKDVALDDLEKAIGAKAYQALLPYLTVTKGVSPRKGAFENIAQLYKKGEKELAEDLTTFVDATISQPQVRAK